MKNTLCYIIFQNQRGCGHEAVCGTDFPRKRRRSDHFPAHYAQHLFYVSAVQSCFPIAGGFFFGRCILFTLVCMATLVVYYSRTELTLRGWWIRTILHAALLEAVLLPLAHHWEFWYGPLDAIIYASFILAAKILWHLVNFGQSIRTATQINEQLLRRQNGQKQGGV